MYPYLRMVKEVLKFRNAAAATRWTPMSATICAGRRILTRGWS